MQQNIQNSDNEQALSISMQLLSSIANEVPTLVGRMLDVDLPNTIIEKIKTTNNSTIKF